MTPPVITSISVPAPWVPYLLGGDLATLQPGDLAKAQAWRQREQVEILDFERDSSGEPGEAYFSWSGRILAPELGVDGCEFVDCRALELSLIGESGE